ncbi:MAG: response regulator [Desulfobulbales bacterium]|nr:response regulator [Desulfobulbales bacterium]
MMEATKKRKILTVEDDEFVRDILVAYLEDSGYEVLQAKDGRLGLQVFRDEHPDLVMLDLRMPEMDGLEVLGHITKESPDTPVILVSGMGTIGDAIKALKLGAWDYIAKPIHDMGVLEHAIKKALERAEFIEQKKRYSEQLEEEVRKRTAEVEQRRLDQEQAYKELQKEVAVRRNAEELLSKINLELTMLSECIHAVIRATDENSLMQEICRIIVDVGGYEMAWVGFAEQSTGKKIKPVAWTGKNDGYLDLVNISWDETANGSGPTGTAMRTSEPVVYANTRDNPNRLPWHDELLKRDFNSTIAVPLKYEDRVLGVLTIYAQELDAFDEIEVTRLTGLANDLAYGISALRTRIEKRQARHEIELHANKLQKALSGIIEVVASTVEVRDPYTAGHQRRVATLAKAIAEEMDLAANQIEGIYMAGIVHDLGKIYVPAEILSKPSRLNDIEFNLIRTHSQVGYDLLKTIDFPWPIANIVHQHHERLNGTGYPQGLLSDKILLEAKIICVADVVEAMASHRPYRPARGVDVALAHIQKERGTLYDPGAVDTCMRLFAEKGFQLD